MNKIISERSIELDLLLQDENLPRAINRLLDFVQDFSTNPQFVTDALQISADQRQLARDIEAHKLVDYQEIDQKNQQIVQRIADLKQKIIEVYQLAIQMHAQNTREHEAVNVTTTDTIPIEHSEQMPPIMECYGLTKMYRKSGFTLVNIDLQLRLGEITGVVGENGNGKTTLFKVITGNLQHDTGKIGFPLLQRAKHAHGVNWIEVKSEIAYVEQELPSWFGTLKQNIQLELTQHGITGTQNEQDAAYILERLGLTEHAQKKWSELSGGYKLRFALAKALVWKPKLLVIDEPLANLDVRSQRIVLNDLKDLAKSAKHPISIIISSQHLHEIESIADNLVFLQQGQMKFSGEKEAIGSDRQNNFFELSCKLDKQALEGLLTGLPVTEIEHNGLSYVITGTKALEGQKILQALLHQDVEIEYFRNISNSAKRLFL